METHHNQLDIPPAAITNPAARELARVWGAAGALHVTLAASTWKDPAAWGIMLVDLARHAARAVAELTGADEAIALRRIREGFDVEWNSPTDEPVGGIDKRSGE